MDTQTGKHDHNQTDKDTHAHPLERGGHGQTDSQTDIVLSATKLHYIYVLCAKYFVLLATANWCRNRV
jgi:hypothetical protein